jgi:hypothetical protein
MPASPNIARRSAFASLIGTCIELYDFYVYATAAAIAFNTLFFPTIRWWVRYCRLLRLPSAPS